MVILSADNPLWPFIQIRDRRSKRVLQNVMWYDTQTGEGSQAIINRTMIPHISTETHYNLFTYDPSTGKPLTGNFKDPNKEVVISIPRQKYEEYRHYIQTLLLNPNNSGQFVLQFVEEYIAGSREDPNFKEVRNT
jgi:hypothetical protein